MFEGGIGGSPLGFDASILIKLLSFVGLAGRPWVV